MRKFLALDLGDKLVLVEAWLYLGLARAALLTFPFRYISPRLGRQVQPDSLTPAVAPPPPIARQVGWAIETMARHTPWESACLSQTIAGKFMLKRRGVKSMLCLGLKKDEAAQLTAHAWLRVGNAVIVGASGHESFTMLSAFGDP